MAGEAWSQAWVEVLPDFSKFRTKANSEMSGVLGSAGTTGGLIAGRNMNDGILGSVPRLGGLLVGAFAALGIGTLIGKTIGEGINYALNSIDLASDLNESFNAVQVTFGKDIAADLSLLSAAAPKSLKITQKSFNEMATRFSSFAKTVVGPGGDVVSFLDDLTTRGADFASVYNTDVDEALQLFQSGLAGESEPLRKYGLDLSAASVAAFAYASGIAKSGTELTEAEKVQARYGLLMQQTADVQGDAANTSGELAAQQRDLAVAFEEVQTKFGTHLLPAFTGIVTFANETLLPKLGEVLDKVGPELAASLEEAKPKFEELWIKAEPLITGLITAAAEDGIPAFIQGMDDFVEHAPEWIEAFQEVDQAVYDMDAEFKNFQTDLQNQRLDRIQWFDDFLNELGNFTTDVGNGTLEVGMAIGTGLRTAVDEFGNFNKDVERNIRTIASTLYNSGRIIFDEFVRGINSMKATVGNAVGNVLDFAADFFPSSPAKRGPFSGAGWAAVAASGSALMDQFRSDMNFPDLTLGSGVNVNSVTSGLQSSVTSSRTASSVGSGGNIRVSGDLGGLQRFVRLEIETADGWRELEITNGATY